MTLGGTFRIELFLQDGYPMKPPVVRFLTKIYHPNIDERGQVCLDVLQGAYYLNFMYQCRHVCMLTCPAPQRQMVPSVDDSYRFSKRSGSSRGPEPG